MLSLDDVLANIDKNLRDKRADLVATVKAPSQQLADLALRRPPKEDRRE